MSSDEERQARVGGSSSQGGRPHGDGGSHHERSGNQAIDAAFDAAHDAYKRQKKARARIGPGPRPSAALWA